MEKLQTPSLAEKTELNHEYTTIHDLGLSRNEVAVGTGEEANVLSDVFLVAGAAKGGRIVHYLLHHGAARNAPAIGNRRVTVGTQRLAMVNPRENVRVI